VRTAFVIAGKDLRLRLRDRSFIFMAVVAPLLLATIISLAIGNSFNNFRADFAVANEDNGPIATAFIDVLKSPQLRNVVTVHTVPSADVARRETRKDIDVAFVIPAGFSAAVVAGQPARLEVIRSQTRLISGQLGEALAKSFASRVQAVQLAVRTALASGSQLDPATLAQQAAAGTPQNDLLRNVPSGGRDLKPAAYFGPAMALFFVFFTVGMGARSLLAERTAGTLARLRAAPINLNAIVVGKVMATFVMGLASVLTLLLTTSVLLGAQWSHPLAVVALAAAAVLAAMGLVTLVISLAKTEQQAGAYGSAVALVLALLGGSFVPISFAPAILRQLTLLTPNGWALKGFTDLATGATGLATVFTAITVCLAVAVVTGGIGLVRVARAVEL